MQKHVTFLSEFERVSLQLTFVQFRGLVCYQEGGRERAWGCSLLDHLAGLRSFNLDKLLSLYDNPNTN